MWLAPIKDLMAGYGVVVDVGFLAFSLSFVVQVLFGVCEVLLLGLDLVSWFL
jgi:hypothetical protein